MEGAGLDPSPSDKTVKDSCKYFTFSPGQTLRCHKYIQNYLCERRPELEESINYKDYDVILAFCHIDPQLPLNDRKESVATFLGNLPGSNPVAVVVLHQTCYPEKKVSDIIGDLPRRNMVKVDCLLQENEELLQCTHNETSLNKVADWLVSEARTEKSRKPPPPTPPKTVKVFSLVTGNTLGSHKQFVGTLCERRAGIQEVSTVQECDIILCFCPVVSKARTDIKAALQNLNNIPVTKDVVLVVLHHTFDPECTVPDSSRAVSREKTLTVDCLFHEDRGILHCNRNEEAFRTVFKLIDTKIKEKKPEIKNLDPCTTVKLFKQPLQKYLIIRPGKTLRCIEDIMQSLQKQRPELQEVFTAEECDVVLAFCCIDPQGRSDIEETMNLLCSLPDSRPVALVVLHQSSYPEHVPDISVFFTREIKFKVDFLFHENEELLRCTENESSLNKVEHWLISEMKEMKPEIKSLPQMKNKFIKVFSLVTGKTLGFHKDFVKTLCDRRAGLQEVSTVEDCDVILCFCPVVSQAVNDIKASLRKLNNETQGSQPVVLVVLHHTFDAESIVPDSSKSVARKNTLAVDCLFFEDRGILRCSKNEETYCRVLAWIESQQSNRESSSAKHLEDDTQLRRFKNDSYREEEGACGQM